MKRLLTIQDVSCVGQCSGTVALPLVSACGVECALLPSSVLSNHTGGFKGWTFLDLAGEMPRIEAQWHAEGIAFDAFYTGYLGVSQIEPTLSILAHCGRSGALKFIDPAMADNGVLYRGFAPDFPRQMARVAATADFLLPNLTEAALLVGETPRLEGYDRAYIEGLIGKLHALGARHVILTGVSFEPEQVGSAVSDGAQVEYDFNPRLKRQSHGTGDVYASVFAGAVLRGWSPIKAAALAADIVCAAIAATPEDHWYGVSFEAAIPQLVRELTGDRA